MGHQHVLNNVVVQHLPIRLGVIDRREVPVDQWIVGHRDCETHHGSSTYVTVHHLQDVREAWPFGCEVLEMVMNIVI